MESLTFIIIYKKKKFMATFWTKTEIDLDVNKIYENLSDREILQLVDLLVEENLVISTNTIKE
jgi:hypothetical protein